MPDFRIAAQGAGEGMRVLEQHGQHAFDTEGFDAIPGPEMLNAPTNFCSRPNTGQAIAAVSGSRSPYEAEYMFFLISS